MALNGISTLPTKRERQDAKLAQAAIDRAAVGNPRSTLDESQLPTLYAVGDNNTNDVVDNANTAWPGNTGTGILTYGRPWTTGG